MYSSLEFHYFIIFRRWSEVYLAVPLSLRCIELLDTLLSNTEEFLQHLALGSESGKSSSSSVAAVLHKELRFLLRSDRLPSLELVLQLWRAEMLAARQGRRPPTFAAPLLRILRFLVAHAASVQQYASVAASLNVTALMADIEALRGGQYSLQPEAVEALQLEALLLLTDLVKKAEVSQEEAEEADDVGGIITASAADFLQDSLTGDTFCILLGNVLKWRAGGGSGSVRQQDASREILRVVMRQSRACLQEGTDLQLLLDLCPPFSSPHFLGKVAQAMLRLDIYSYAVYCNFVSDIISD